MQRQWRYIVLFDHEQLARLLPGSDLAPLAALYARGLERLQQQLAALAGGAPLTEAHSTSRLRARSRVFPL